MFEKAAQKKFRYSTPQGLITTEDLFDLPLTHEKGAANLNDIAKDLFRAIRSEEEETFVKKTSTRVSLLEEKFTIVKHIIDLKLAEAEARELRRANAAKKQQILGLIAQKQNERLASQSIEDLMKMVEEL